MVTAEKEAGLPSGLKGYIHMDIQIARHESHMNTIKVRKVGNSLTITLPVSVASRLRVEAGDSVHLTELPDGSYRLTPHDPEFESQLETGESLIRRYRNTLKALSE